LEEVDERREYASRELAVGVVSFEDDTGVLLLVKDPRDIAVAEFFAGVRCPEDDAGDPKSTVLRKCGVLFAGEFPFGEDVDLSK
jgi:hypothetical protein